ncbi:hypothetical protein BU25DRAFT_240079 [Macroventuria anomochaeta]|uniref:Uncharacterized protein n=1 Tax=Macroventuria anomochaeta TaxID=301207 RepID=A0ACB6RHB4_9PLEO|nr:uncharacterized protein BU25DRAFT_240079 [Macroventuria anomochaeta]KAF2621300.1 hypothetical protein BU25DRAFT_240079 [Macroventuria anomochaeta]
MLVNVHSLQHAAQQLASRQTHLLSGRQPPPPPHPPISSPPPPPQFDNAPSPIGDMGNNNKDGKDIHSEETILFLFLTFGILIVLILILLLLGFQTYLSWRIAGVLVEGSDDSFEADKDFRRWDRERKERKKALRALEKGRSVRGSWGYGSGSRGTSGGGRPRTDEEMGMSGARGSSMMLDKFLLEGKEKKPFWNLKRWI